MKVLVAVASRHRATREIAEVIADELKTSDLDVDLRDAEAAPDIGGYEAVILGSAVYTGSWLPAARHLVDFQGPASGKSPSGSLVAGRSGLTSPSSLRSTRDRLPDESDRGAGAQDLPRQARQTELGVRRAFVDRVVEAPEGDYRDVGEVMEWANSIASQLAGLNARRIGAGGIYDQEDLVPLDGSQAAESVLPYVERMAAATNAGVLLLAAVDRPRDWGEDTSGDLKGERHEAEAYLRSLQARLASATGNDVECEVVSSEPAAAILDAAETGSSDLIAMTTHGRSGVARWVLGSVATKLLHATNLPLLMVRPPAEGKQAALELEDPSTPRSAREAVRVRGPPSRRSWLGRWKRRSSCSMGSSSPL